MEPIALATTTDDVGYVKAHYAPLDQLVRDPVERDWPGTHLPRATYRLADGSLWVPRDWRRLLADAGDIARLPGLFLRRLRAAADALHHTCDPQAEWSAYLAGLYGACLRDVTPEAIVAKDRLVAQLDRALADPRPRDPAWCVTLRADVEALDGLSRPFATCDRIRFGRPTSRDRLIDGPRRAFPEVFAIP
jgi:hypothetical protein